MAKSIDDLFYADYDESLGLAGRFDNYDPESVSLSGIDLPEDEGVAEYAQGVGETWAEMLRGVAAGTIGGPGEIESLIRGVKAAMQKQEGEDLGDAFLRGMDEPTFLPTGDEVSAAMPQLDTEMSPEDKRAADQIGQMLGFGVPLKAVAKAPKAATAVAGMAPATAQASKGIYNNPGNVEATEGWAGDTGERYGENGRFAVFDSPEMGLRALIRDVRTKINDRSIKGDISKLITKYAPNTENPTDKYIAYVKKEVGKEKVGLRDAAKVAKAILEFENKPEVREYYLKDPKIFKTAAKLATRGFDAGVTLEQAKAEMGIK